jgi:hypothetical protein
LGEARDGADHGRAGRPAGASIVSAGVARALPGAARFLAGGALAGSALAGGAPATLGELSGLLAARPSNPSPALRRAAARLAGRGRPDGPGPDDSAPAESALLSRPVLAANHHGLDTHPEMVQAALISGLASILGGHTDPVVILATSAVPLNNPTAPGGLLAGRRGPGWRRPQARLFSRRLDHVMAGRAPALARGDAAALLGRLRSLPGWTEPERKAAGRFIERFLLAPGFLERDRFLDQASWLASEIWADRLALPRPGPPLVHLELEALVGACLGADLADPASAVHRALCHGPTRSALAAALAGRRGAWSADLLDTGPSGPAGGRGTMFFWAADAKGVRRPMGLGSGRGRAVLRGGGLELPLAPEPLVTALAEGLVAPGLFLDYLALSANGLAAHGGVFMIDYLPALLGPASAILEVPLGLGPGAGEGAGEGAGPLLGAGLLPIGLEAPGTPGGYAAAGALELMGPLDEGFFRTLAGLRLDQVRDFTFGEWYQEEVPPERRQRGWEAGLGVPAMLLGGGWWGAG